MKKRIVSLLLALVMAVSLLPVSAFAAEVDVPAAQDVPTVEQQNDENTKDVALQAANKLTFTLNSDLSEANAKFNGEDYVFSSGYGAFSDVDGVSYSFSDRNIDVDVSLASYDKNCTFVGWKIIAGEKSWTGTELDIDAFAKHLTAFLLM